jgi:D-glycero-D-manno-heptose 1,7-bisphosphate phosphatase
MATQAVFLDRDGVICKNRADYVKSWDEFLFLPGAKQGIATLSKLNIPIVVVTNQSAIGRGIMSAEEVAKIHRGMTAEIAAAGGRIDKILFCPHRPDEGCNCRKPEPGMLLQAAQELNIDLQRSFMVGDALTDLMAGQRVGCFNFLVMTGRGLQQVPQAMQALPNGFTVTRNLAEAALQIVNTVNNA